MKHRVYILLLVIMVLNTMPGFAVESVNTSCESCNDDDLSSDFFKIPANVYNMFDLCNYYRNQGITVFPIKVDPRELKEGFLAQYIDTNLTSFIPYGVKTVNVNGQNVSIDQSKFTGYALVFDRPNESLYQKNIVSEEEMKNVQIVPGVILAALLWCLSCFPCRYKLQMALTEAGTSLIWCSLNKDACCNKFWRPICQISGRC